MWIRGIFDKETRRKPLAFAADAGLWELNRLSSAIDRINQVFHLNPPSSDDSF